ncbi:U3 small nucleolar RNA-associated protein 23 [Nematocida parisii]|nr:U3 small nucleolar RNA-associated protein 23 [Nematocida parisii]KAI5127593.1 U3 small nucleolar RNA-associated protein 23 [Nematocida parisii]KAI5129230.1 U3 small nucleolar RNA-associated protein 23 [Nematocida parisii]KAI5131260.1 U3 small nucleolar RNA-associated protein 23 [Nematocida parisii]KAI5140275.1 U3 small nucleolar RNA-associated protein 23 [Nematocida parisii]
MKAPRLKQIRRLVKNLERAGYRAPFNILADHEFLIAYHKSQMSLGFLEKLLNGKIRVSTTSCEYKRYTAAVKDKKLIGYVALKKCKHADEFRTLECLSEVVADNNPHHYFMAVAAKYARLKEEKKVPVIFIRSGVVCIETDPSLIKDIKEKEPEGLSSKEKERLEAMFNDTVC